MVLVIFKAFIIKALYLTMRNILTFLLLVSTFSCKEPTAAGNTSAGNIHDPHSLANPSEVIVKHLDLDIAVDFNAQQISGKASWTIENIAAADKIVFDSHQLLLRLQVAEHHVKSDCDQEGDKQRKSDLRSYFAEKQSIDAFEGNHESVRGAQHHNI